MFINKTFINIVLLSSAIFSKEVIGRDDELIVNLVVPQGGIRGHTLRTTHGKDYYAFQDIPFAAPPIGSRRFKPPQYHAGWDQILNTTENRKICIQFHPDYSSQPLEGETEDCLVLNVYTPKKPGSKSTLPVLVWIHGGAFFEGSAQIKNHNANYFIDEDIVVVTTNYRLGPLGFLSTGDDVIPGNIGLKDQHLALDWTVKNIHLFAGDAQKIVLAGHSAGAFAVSSQVLSRENKGFFRGVIQQSSSSLSAAAFQTNPEQYALQMVKQLNIIKNSNKENSTRHIDILWKASIDDIRRATKMIVANESTNGFLPYMIWTPVMEKKNSGGAIVTSPMRESFKEGNFNLAPTLIGIASEESLHFLRGAPDENFDESARLYDEDSALLIHPRLNIDENERKMAGCMLKEVYTPTTFLNDNYAFVRYTSDVVFARPVIEQAHLMAKHVPVYLYQFGLRSEDASSLFPGSPHTSELPYIWYDQKLEPDLEENGVTRMVRMWSNFIKYLNPTPEEDPLIQNIKWPRLNSSNMEYLNINTNLSVKTNPRKFTEMKEVLDKYLRRPLNVY